MASEWVIFKGNNDESSHFLGVILHYLTLNVAFCGK